MKIALLAPYARLAGTELGILLHRPIRVAWHIERPLGVLNVPRETRVAAFENPRADAPKLHPFPDKPALIARETRKDDRESL